MAAHGEAITVKVSGSEKTEYRHWCVDYAAGNMSTALRALVVYIITYKPTWVQVINALETLQGAGDG